MQNPKQTAALLIFPPDVTPEKAQAFLNRILQSYAPAWNVQILTPYNPSQQPPDLLSTPVNTLQITVRSSKAIKTLNVKTIGELITKAKELSEVPNFGKTSFNELQQELAKLGLKFNSPEEFDKKRRKHEA